MTDYVPSIFESFNARSLAPDQVAKTFIPPKAFTDLVKRNHSILIGPRGSGKTTLLKMLQVAALRSWNHPQAAQYRDQIEFTGIFVPADVAWGAQIDSLVDERALGSDLTTLLKRAAFTNHILIAFVDAFRDRCQVKGHPFLNVDLDKQQEAKVVSALANVWGLELPFCSLLNLRLAIRKRLIKLPEIASRLSISGGTQRSGLLEDENYLHQDFQALLSSGIDVVNDYTNLPYDKWGLLFDELEVAPDSIRHSLIRSVRSTDERLIFKLSLSPYNKDSRLFESDNSAMSGQDFSPIRLWYANQTECIEFSNRLLESLLREKGLSEVDPADVLGKSSGVSDEDDTKTRYNPGSTKYNQFKELSESDRSFRLYLEKYQINLAEIEKMTEEDRAKYIRKVTAIVPLRLEYRRKVDPNTSSGLRSRKNYRLYTRFPSVFLFAEGNPRWLIGLLTNLLSETGRDQRAIPDSRQSKEIEVVMNRYRAMLRTIPISFEAIRSRGLLSFVDKIGEYLSGRILDDDFNPEPPLTFTVDSSVSPAILEAVGKALNAGAIVFTPDGSNEEFLTSLRGKRFRLTYMLAPYFKLPLILGRSMSLGAALGKDIDSIDHSQATLFGEIDEF